MFSLIPYQPRSTSLFRYMDDLERSFLNGVNAKNQFRTDISEKENAYLLEAELPGFSPNDINVEVNNDLLTISATHSEENAEKDDAGNYVRRERRFGSFARSFNVEGIDADSISASYQNGVLSVELPKAVDETPKARKIEITST